MDDPIAKQIPHAWERPTGTVSDPWAWLADRDDPDTVGYLEAENRCADAWFAPHEDLTETLFTEIRSRVQEDDSSVPVRHGDWWYVSRMVEGSAYPIHGRAPVRADLPDAGRADAVASHTVILDENVEAEGHEFFSLGTFDISHDHTLLAWSLDVDGSEHFTLHIRDIATGHDHPDELHDTTWAGTAWSTDGTHLFYVTADEQERPFRVWRHRVGTAQADDVVVLEDLDERFFVSVGLTRSGEWIVIECESKTSSEVFVIPATSPTTPPRVVRERQPEVEYHLDHWGDRFVILTNAADDSGEAADFRVVTAPIDDPSTWTEFVAHRPGRRITRVEAFATHLVLHEWSEAQPVIRVVDRDGTSTPLELGDEPHDVDLDSNPEWHTDTLRFSYESLTVPNTLYEQHLPTGERLLLKRTPTPNVDLDLYTSHREWAVSPDGTRIPVDVMRRHDTPPGGPCVVYGYGSYEASMAPWFSVARLSLVDRGWTWALVHPRGGGELGRAWYENGKFLQKRNTFDDTNACAEHLLGTNQVSSVAIRGGSAGGLLVGACLNLRPDLWSAAVAEVPFVDVVTTMSDPSLPLTVTEWEEWGDPREEPFASYIASYSPYDNTTSRDYPPLYVTAGLNDPRVAYHEPAKWVAKIRAVRTNDAALVLKTEMGAGHAGPSGRYDRWRDEARVLTFLLVTAEG
jgi:oligopeptidase B